MWEFVFFNTFSQPLPKPQYCCIISFWWNQESLFTLICLANIDYLYRPLLYFLIYLFSLEVIAFLMFFFIAWLLMYSSLFILELLSHQTTLNIIFSITQIYPPTFYFLETYLLHYLIQLRLTCCSSLQANFSVGFSLSCSLFALIVLKHSL